MKSAFRLSREGGRRDGGGGAGFTQIIHKPSPPDVKVFLGLAETRGRPRRAGADDCVHSRLAVRRCRVPSVEVGLLKLVPLEIHQAHLCRAELAFSGGGCDAVALHAGEEGFVVRLEQVCYRGGAEVEESRLDVLAGSGEC